VPFTGYPQVSTGVIFNLTNQITILEELKFIDIIQVQMNFRIDISPNQATRWAG